VPTDFKVYAEKMLVTSTKNYSGINGTKKISAVKSPESFPLMQMYSRYAQDGSSLLGKMECKKLPGGPNGLP
jgi:hypothetical protein